MTNGNTNRRFDPVTATNAAAALFSIVLAVCIVGFVPLSHPAVTRKAAELARRFGGDSCSIGSVRIVLWKGITVRDVRWAGALGTAGRRSTVNAGTLVLHGSFIQFMLHYKEFERCAPYGAAFTKEPAEALRILCRCAAGIIGKVTVADAAVMVLNRNGPLLQGHNCSLAVIFTKNGGGDFDGSFSAAALRAANATVMRRLSGNVTCRGNVISLSRCSGRCLGGRMQCDARFDFVRGALANLTFSITGLDFDEWYKQADTAAGRLSGKADCRLALDSSALAVDSLRGTVTMAAAPCVVSQFPLQRTLAGMFEYPVLTRLHFRKFTADGTVKPKGVITTEVSGDGDSISLRASGWIGINGQLNQKTECFVTRIAVPSLPRFARKTLEATSDGGRVLRLRIFGDIATPKFAIESKVILLKAVQNIFDDVRDNFKQWFKGNGGEGR
jgi:hypothetical protein